MNEQTNEWTRYPLLLRPLPRSPSNLTPQGYCSGSFSARTTQATHKVGAPNPQAAQGSTVHFLTSVDVQSIVIILMYYLKLHQVHAPSTSEETERCGGWSPVAVIGSYSAWVWVPVFALFSLWLWQISYHLQPQVSFTCKKKNQYDICLPRLTGWLQKLYLTRYIKALWKLSSRTSLKAQCLRIHLPMQRSQVRALVWEDPTCRGATKPVCHNYWACALKPASHNYWAHVPQLLRPTRLQLVLQNKRSHGNEKLAHRDEE